MDQSDRSNHAQQEARFVTTDKVEAQKSRADSHKQREQSEQWIPSSAGGDLQIYGRS